MSLIQALVLKEDQLLSIRTNPFPLLLNFQVSHQPQKWQYGVPVKPRSHLYRKRNNFWLWI